MSDEPTRLRMEWTAETVHEGLDALAKQLMLAGTGLPVQHTVTWSCVGWRRRSALAWTAHHALAGIVLAAFSVALGLRWVFRVREETGPS
jgi:hypothetical protein